MAHSTTRSSRSRLAPLALLLLPLIAQAIVLNPHIDHSLNDAPAASASSAAAAEKRDAPVRIPLHHLTSRQHSDDLEVRQQWLKDQARGLRSKYSQYLNAEGQAQVKRDLQELEHERAKRELAGGRLSKRANGTVQLTDVGVDASYAGTVSVGSPSQDFLLILDTGSADMWIADADCSSSSCRSIPTFNPSSSSSLQESSTPFDITYGSGQAAGVVATDTVTMGGFTISNQGFGLVTNISTNLISNPLSGLMGLAWASIAQTGATPFWQNLASSGQWSQAEMGFYMRRWRGVRGVQTVESDGGELTLGGLDSSKYTGSVNYINFPSSNEDYWRIPVQGMTVQGNSISLSSPSAAIDTGTTLVGVPSSVIRSVYGNIQGSQSLAAYGYNGYYQYPCSTTVNIALQFGGLSYSISNQDFNLGPYTQDTSMCTGAFFQMDLSSNSPISWIVGATFLKNVYSVFRYNPPAVGFAALSDNAGAVSNGTITTTNNGGTTGSTSAAGRGAQAMSAGLVLAAAGVAAAAAW